MGARILVVEDDAFTCRDITLHLENHGYHVCGNAETAEQAVALALAERPDLVLMDIVLKSERDGIDAANEIHAHLDVPIVYLTAYSDRKLLERAKISEPYGYILKPYSGRELHVAISFALYKWQSDHRLRAAEWAESAFSALPSAVLATNAAGTVEHLNPAAEALFGIRSTQISGQTLARALPLLPESVRHMLMAMVSETAQTKRPAQASVVLPRPGTDLTVQLTVTATALATPTQGVLLAFQPPPSEVAAAPDLAYRASHDPLTGLINRPAFEMRLQTALRTVRGEGRRHALCYVDLDRFNVINDTFGHSAGDELLQQLAGRMAALGNGKRTLARLGGDEFALLIEDCSLDEAHAAAEALRRAVQDFRFQWQDKAFEVGVSIGIVPVSDGALTSADVIDAADAACFLAKEMGRNRVYLFAPDDPRLMRRNEATLWAQRIRNAIDEQRLVLYSQHVVPLTGSTKKRRPMSELLVRMRGEKGEMIEPAAFLSAAEQHQLLPQIDRWVIHGALSLLAEMDRKHELFSINLSGQSLGAPETLDYVRDQLAAHQIDPSQLCFELTENAAVVHVEQARRFIRTLRDQGCSFALDDFGSGQSSYRYLKQLPIDFLKIDGCFVRGLATDHVDYAMVHAVNELGKLMGVKTVAEQVDSQDALSRLCALGIGYAQGFRLHRPEPFLGSTRPTH